MTTASQLSPRQPPDTPLAASFSVSNDRLWVTLKCGRMLGVPLCWRPALVLASAEQRANGQLLDDGAVLYWPDVDEHVSVKSLLFPAISNT